MFGFHAIGLAIGAIIGPLVGGLLGQYLGLAVCRSSSSRSRRSSSCSSGLRLHEPGRGHWERAAAGADAERRRHRRGAAVVRGIDPHPLAGRHAAPHLVLAAVPRGVVHRARHAHVALLRAGVPPRRLPARHRRPRSPNRRRSSRSSSASRSRRGSCCAIPGSALRMLAVVGIVIAAAWIVFALAPWLWFAIAMNVIVTGLVVAARARHLRGRCRSTIPPKVRSMGFAMAALFIVPGLSRSTSSAASPTPTGIRAGLLVVAPIFLIGAWILASGSLYVQARHQPGVDVDRGAGRSDVQAAAGRSEAAARAQRRRALRQRAGAVRRQLRGRRRRDRRAARHERRRQVDAAEDDLRPRRGDERRGRVRRARHDVRAAERGRRARRRA